MPSAPHGTVTFLFTDVEGSTRLWDRSPEAMRTALAAHDHILRSAIADQGGYIFSTAGDAFAAAFWTPTEALSAAVDAQRRLRAEAWPEPAVLRVRMGLHTGTADERNGDYFGSAVNRAARIMAAAHGGQVLLSLVTEELVRDRLPDGLTLVDLGEQTLSGLARPELVYQVYASGLDRRFPPLRTQRVGVGNLPAQLTSFVGHEEELKHLAGAFPTRRLITLTGPGGVGKTRVAIEAAGLAVDAFPDGTWLCELAPVGTSEGVAHAVAAALSIRLQETQSMVDSVADTLRGRKLLLVLDNCEHVLDAVALLVGRISASCPTVSLLATSREPIGVAGERVWPVPSLDAATDGVELFRHRAADADAALPEPGEHELATIAGICQRLDGIPLAIELAAARARSLTLGDLADRLGDRFRLLRGGRRGGVERHQTLRTTVQWSYQLLDGAERTLFDRLSVFAGSFDCAAVEAVCATDVLDGVDVDGLLVSLVDKSMVVADRSGAHTRFRLLETLRQYGEERLVDAGRAEAFQHRHVEHFVEVARRACRQVKGHAFAAGSERFEIEWDNLRAALHRAADRNEADAALRDALRHLYATRNWMLMGGALQTTAVHLADTGRVEPAAVLLGYLEARGIRPPGPGSTRGTQVERRREFLTELGTMPEAAAWLARGAELDRDQVVEYALDELANGSTDRAAD